MALRDDQVAGIVGCCVGFVALVVAGLLSVIVMLHETTTEALQKHQKAKTKELNKKNKTENAKVFSVQELSERVQAGAIAFLKTEYLFLTAFVIVVGVVVLLVVDWEAMICFFVGAIFSGSCGWAGMLIATYANSRTAVACATSLSGGLRVAFNAGAVMGLSVVGSGLLGVSGLYLIFEDLSQLAGFGMGASAIALFARVGGGIYTKAADVGADLVGKVRNDLPEDDIRNAGVIADNVGDNVGDVAGMGADLFESFVGSIIAAQTLGRIVLGDMGVAMPLWLASAGILCSIIGVFLVRTKEGADLERLLWSIRLGIGAAGVLIIGVAALGTHLLDLAWEYFGCVIIGLATGIAFGYFTEYTTAYTYEPVRSISRAGAAGAAPVIIQGLGVGLLSTFPPVILIVVCILACYELGDNANPPAAGSVVGGGAFGVTLSALGMLSTLGVTLATDAYGPVADNAGGLAEMAHLDEDVRANTDRLDSLGNTTAATGKGFAIGSGVLTAIGLMIAYTDAVEIDSMDIIVDAKTILPGILLGSMAPFVFAALTMLSVRKSAMMIMHVVDKELEDEDIMSYRKEADYEYCVRIATTASLQEMVLPGLLALSVPFVVGIGLGPRALGGVLIGAIGSGFLLAVTMANAGGAWDNAKKWVKAEKCEGSPKDKAVLINPATGKAHKDVSDAVVSGDTVGDPFKDTSGPSLNILFKLMSMVSLVLAPAFKQSVHDDYWYIAIIILVVVGALALAWYIFLEYKYSTILSEFNEKAMAGTPSSAAIGSSGEEDEASGSGSGSGEEEEEEESS